MKPIIKPITTFDASNEYPVEFSWSGSRAYGNRLVIYDAESLSTVYDETIQTYALSHTIPAGTLTNGNKYLAQISVYDYQSVNSELSNKYAFYVFSTPTFEFENITDEKTFDSSSVQAIVKYSQAEYEYISSYKFYLYDANNNILQISDQMYNRTDIVYSYKGLENNTYYYIQCIGVTVNGMPIETPKVKIFIKYENASAYARFFAESDVKHGGNKWNTNIVLIEYTGNETFEYIDGNYINLEEKVIYYDEGFSMLDDGTIVINGKSLYKNNNHIFSGYNKDSSYQVNLYSYIYDDVLRFKLVVNNSMCDYVLYSNPMVFTNDDDIEIRIRKSNDVYSLETYIEGVKVE